MSTNPTSSTVAAVVVLAAGGGTRMKSRRSKLLHEIAGRPLVAHALDAVLPLAPTHLAVVVGHLREQVEPVVAEVAPEARTVVQAEQRGTGHAVRVAIEALAADGALAGEVVVTYGDVPLLEGETLQRLVDTHRADGNAVTVLSASIEDPTGYGRIVRDGDGAVSAIVEHKDADAATRAIREINSGIFVFEAGPLADALTRLTDDNAQGEYYLTDVPAIVRGDGGRVGAFECDDLWQTQGVNDRVQLHAAAVELNRRLLEGHMRAGVTVLDPATTWIEQRVSLGTDVTLLPGTILAGATSIGDGVTLGPDTRLVDCEVGNDAEVVRTEATLATIGTASHVGPFAHLRPGSVVGAGCKVGAFVELKAATLGDGAKVGHLAYVGDATLGASANLGAGTVVANYDGLAKHRTTIGEAAFVGSNSTLVSPVELGPGAFVAAGSTITDDVAPGDLGVARGRQHNASGWVAHHRAGSRADEAARAADGQE